MMHYDGSFVVAANRTKAFEFATDPSRVGTVFPEVSDIVVQDAEHFALRAKVGIASVKGAMDVKCTIVEKVPLTSVKLKLLASGLSSGVEMESMFSFEDTSGGGTLVHWTADAVVAGLIASLGSRLTDSVAKKYIHGIIESLKRELS
jgi:carbon monoxide dehydrogenase subunit G